MENRSPYRRRVRQPRRGSIIDPQGYRANVGILLCNDIGQLFWGKKTGMNAWQFPQGGIRPHESFSRAMFRELHEEVGLLPEHVEILGSTREWIRYRLPSRYIRSGSRPLCVGQKQIWFLLRLLADEGNVRLDASRRPEFDHWRWIDFGAAVEQVVDFKREVYRQVMIELSPLLLQDES